MKINKKLLMQTVSMIALFFAGLSQAQAQYLSTTAKAPDSPWSVDWLARAISPNDHTGNALLNDVTLTYNINKSVSVSLEGGYEQMTNPDKVQTSDFEDTELALNYSFSPKHIHPNLTFDFSLIGVLPTSKYDQDTTEQGGLGLSQTSSVETSWVKVSLRNKAYGYFYQYEQTSKLGDAPEVPVLGGDDEGGSVAPLVTTSNIAYYFDQYLTTTVPVFSKDFKLRNTFRFESYVHFDGETQQIFHVTPSMGYAWNKIVSTWVALDCAKATTDASSVFDGKNSTGLFNLIVSF